MYVNALCFFRMTKDEDSLSIADVYRRDEGIYTCRVKSELEEVTASAKLTVTGTCTFTLSIHATSINMSILFMYTFAFRPPRPAQ